ncbi:MAG: GIY-YIG nuclease family protein [Acetobacteraceae bacterium]|nr:GIY-YIG nuclease family protein [Acetobacteraceae bacterium]
MANKLAGQRAKYSKAFADFSRTDDEDQKIGPIRRMMEVIQQAPANGFTEAEVTNSRDLPDEVRRLLTQGARVPEMSEEDPDQLVRQRDQMVDISDTHEEGNGDQCVYAYGYRCAPDRLKVGRTDGDVIDRIARQIATSTPEKPSLFLVIRTSDSRALEMAMHGVLRLRRMKIIGGGDEWFLTTRDELLEIYRAISGPAANPLVSAP